KNILQII
ncbi:hypothetical protein ACTFIV_003187, partial [Dictyostelium citrinum]